MRRDHKKLDPEIKAMRAIVRGISLIPVEAERRCLEFIIASRCGLPWVSLPMLKSELHRKET